MTLVQRFQPDAAQKHRRRLPFQNLKRRQNR
jgi:hypothetical protein